MVRTWHGECDPVPEAQLWDLTVIRAAVCQLDLLHLDGEVSRLVSVGEADHSVFISVTLWWQVRFIPDDVEDGVVVLVGPVDGGVFQGRADLADAAGEQDGFSHRSVDFVLAAHWQKPAGVSHIYFTEPRNDADIKCVCLDRLTWIHSADGQHPQQDMCTPAETRHTLDLHIQLGQVLLVKTNTEDYHPGSLLVF